jgi:ABC-type antimicrobial peptide transport system permease subunit
MTTPAISTPLKQQFPEIKHLTRIVSFNLLTNSDVLLKRINEEGSFEPNGYMADSTFFDVFKMPFVKGTPKIAFNDPNSIIISSSLAKKYFGKDDPIGQMMKLDNFFDLKVSGVFSDFPKRSHLNIDFIIPLSIMKRLGQKIDENWSYIMLNTYAELIPGTSASLEKKIKNIHKVKDPASTFELALQPLKKIHLFSTRFEFDLIVKNAGDAKKVAIFSIIAIFILMIACINFMNLSTARASRRAKEVGIRKVVGSDKLQLVRQFLGESILMVFIANILAMILVEFSLPYFNNFSGKELFIDYGNPMMYLFLTAFILLTGIIAGIYPAFFLSAFKPVKVLKDTNTSIRRGANLRKVLVIFQFTIVVFLIVCTIFVWKQSEFLVNKKIGIEKERIVYFMRRGALVNNFDAFKNDLLANPAIKNVCLASDLPIQIRNQESGVTWEDKKPDETSGFALLYGDYDLFKTFNIQLASGRSYSTEFPGDQESSFIVNESAVKRMGLKEPIGSTITVQEKKGTIVGVVKDFNFAPLFKPISPMIIFLRSRVTMTFVKLNPGNIKDQLAFLEKTYKKHNPDFPFDYKFLDQTYEAQYKNEQRTSKLLGYFAIFGIFIACLGLLGLVNFFSLQRTKEIGIRKTHGASNLDIIRLISGQFAKWVFIANILASPLAFYAIHKWLENFAYKIDIVVWPFILAAVISFVFTLTTILYQTLKSANRNPVESLKYE